MAIKKGLELSPFFLYVVFFKIENFKLVDLESAFRKGISKFAGSCQLFGRKNHIDSNLRVVKVRNLFMRSNFHVTLLLVIVSKKIEVEYGQ